MKRGMGWPIGITLVLAATVALNVIVLRIATEPNAYATEPDYYRKAVTWDSTARAERASEATGWTCDAQIVRSRAGLELRLQLVDAEGGPIDGARVHVTAIHNLAASQPSEILPIDAGAGTYVAKFPGAHAGLWELRITAAHGADRFVADLRRDAPDPP